MRRDGFFLLSSCRAIVYGACLAMLAHAVQADEKASPEKLPAASSAPVDFVRDVLPIFQRTCYSCHGPEHQEGGLRLDVKQRAIEGGDRGKAFVAGKSAESRLIQLVAGLDEEIGPMPPEGEGTPLTAEQIGVLRAWIDQGAQWPDEVAGGPNQRLWATEPLHRPDLPQVQDPTWLLNPIDAFILARLEQEKIVPAPPADRLALLRRVHLDLLGLPPTPRDIEDYLADSRPDAYEHLVDRLLSSPHFGERWGRHWLDLARYADSDGYEKDRPRPFAWRYRNWVLDAVNRDMPFDQFTIEQIAGDMLPGGELEQRVATGFHRNTLHNTEGGIDPEEDRVKKTVDRTNTVGAIWMALTVGCAQCHSHKYDPLTQREYYQLYSYFNSIDEQDIDAPLAVQLEKYEQAKAAYDREHAPYLAAVTAYEQEKLPAAQAAWESSALASSCAWFSLDPSSSTSRHGAKLDKQSDSSLLAKGENKTSDVYVVEAAANVAKLRAIRLEVLPDDSLVKKGPGRADNGNFVLSTLTLEVLPADEGAAPMKIALHKAKADFSQKECAVAQAINDNPDDFWAVSPKIGDRHVAVFEAIEPVELKPGTKLRVTLDQKYESGPPHNIGRFRLSITDTSGDVTLEGMPGDVATALAKASADRTAEEAKRVAEYFRTVDKDLQELVAKAEAHAKKAPKAPDTKAQAVAQRAETRPTHIHLRGDFLSPGDPVNSATPPWLAPLRPRGDRSDRLDLAHWLVSSDNPLTPRVTANRIWAQVFSRGIVRTLDDFGKQGELPSHPELLDWLAAEFRDSGWSVKHLLRRIVTSNVYRQSSMTRTELTAIDPENVLLARQNRRRVEAEIIRDLTLAAGGLLDPRLGGPSVRPPQPAEYSRLTYANSASWAESKGGDRYRRGMYTFFQRTSPYPMLMTFDSPDATECCVERESSNTPLQALTLWNDAVFFEAAQSLARRVVAEVPSSGDEQETIRQRATYVFQVCLTRSPTEDELNEVRALYAAQWTNYMQDKEQAAAAVGKAAVPEGTSVEELAAWVMVGRALLNLDEFITRE